MGVVGVHPRAGASSSLFSCRLANDRYDVIVGAAPRRDTPMLQITASVRPMQMSDLTLAGFVSVGLSIIAVEREVTVRTRINAHPGDRLLLIGALY